ncbi:MAG: methyltransferase domain-containing protein [Eubacterium sp.]
MADWNAELYSKFLKDRTQPSIDLANRITLDNPQSIIDIGCGPGNSTRVLKDKFPNARVIGVDSSKDMIKTAKSNYNDIEFMLFDACKDFDKLNDKFDIVFSNACIQWIPNHEKLLADMMGILNDGGMLAVQTPMNYKEPIHIIIEKLVSSDKWKKYFPNPREFYNLKQEEYFDLLSNISSDFTIWETVYCHRMPSHESIMEWYRSTGLRPYLSALSGKKAKELEKDVFVEVQKEYPIQKNGEIIFRFPRFFFIATK